MIKDLILHHEEQLSETQCSAQAIRSTLQSLKSKKELINAILLREDLGRTLLLFILQDDPFSCYALNNDSFSLLSVEEFLGGEKNPKGTLKLFKISPIFFKILLVLAQKKPDVFAGSDLIHIENLLERLEATARDAVLSLKKKDETSLFYFINGTLSEAYFDNETGLSEESHLRDKLLIYTYSASEEDLLRFSLYYDLELDPIDGVGKPFLSPDESPGNSSVNHPLLILIQKDEVLEEDNPIEMVLDRSVFTLGRDPENDWVVDDPASSRKHAQIECCKGDYYIVDRESRNGTLVNQNQIKRHKLSDGDRVQIGLHYFVFSETRNDDAESSSSKPLQSDQGDHSSGPMADNKQKNLPLDGKISENWGLEVISGDAAGTFFELAGSRSIGRGNTDIHLRDPQISRHHADIKWTDEGFVLTDCQSANGVFINDERITEKPLLVDDVIKVGDTQFRVVCKE